MAAKCGDKLTRTIAFLCFQIMIKVDVITAINIILHIKDGHVALFSILKTKLVGIGRVVFKNQLNFRTFQNHHNKIPV